MKTKTTKAKPTKKTNRTTIQIFEATDRADRAPIRIGIVGATDAQFKNLELLREEFNEVESAAEDDWDGEETPFNSKKYLSPFEQWLVEKHGFERADNVGFFFVGFD